MLDAVAWHSVKTPTAAAEWLIARGTAELDLLRRLAADTVMLSSQHVAAGMRRLDYIAGQLPQMALGHPQRRRARLDALAEQLPGLVAASLRLAALGEMLEALSPEATMRRGYSVLRIDGRAVTDAAAIPPGALVEATLARGTALLRREKNTDSTK